MVGCSAHRGCTGRSTATACPALALDTTYSRIDSCTWLLPLGVVFVHRGMGGRVGVGDLENKAFPCARGMCLSSRISLGVLSLTEDSLAAGCSKLLPLLGGVVGQDMSQSVNCARSAATPRFSGVMS